ncbi:MAG: sulfite exporter TauE/SafE family protein, partial [Bacteroidota bacterium]|nr:sulfite exporter TauE/SafE family protein [Bacteroidota bacterium]
MEHWEIAFFFLIIAFTYASVGFGGGSSYLAILAVYALPFKEIRLVALLCNIIVVTGGTIIFIRKGQT